MHTKIPDVYKRSGTLGWANLLETQPSQISVSTPSGGILHILFNMQPLENFTLKETATVNGEVYNTYEKTEYVLEQGEISILVNMPIGARLRAVLFGQYGQSAQVTLDFGVGEGKTPNEQLLVTVKL